MQPVANTLDSSAVSTRKVRGRTGPRGREVFMTICWLGAPRARWRVEGGAGGQCLCPRLAVSSAIHATVATDAPRV